METSQSLNQLKEDQTTHKEMKKLKKNKHKAHSRSFCINLNFSVVVTYNMFHSVVVLRTHAFLEAGKRVSRLMAWYTDQLGSLPEDTVSRRTWRLCVIALVGPARTGRDDTHTTHPPPPCKVVHVTVAVQAKRGRDSAAAGLSLHARG